MSKKQEFFEFFNYLVENCKEPVNIPDNIQEYIDALRNETTKVKPLFTDNGKQILEFMRSTEETMLKAKDIAEGLFTSGRTVSGSLRKLVNDGYVEKVAKDPVIYSLTELGKTVELQ